MKILPVNNYQNNRTKNCQKQSFGINLQVEDWVAKRLPEEAAIGLRLLGDSLKQIGSDDRYVLAKLSSGDLGHLDLGLLNPHPGRIFSSYGTITSTLREDTEKGKILQLILDKGSQLIQGFKSNLGLSSVRVDVANLPETRTIYAGKTVPEILEGMIIPDRFDPSGAALKA